MDMKLRITPNYCKRGAVHNRSCGTCRDLFLVGPDNVQYYRSPTPSPPKPLSPIVCKCKPPNLEWCQDCYNDKLILDWEERGRFDSSDDSDAEN
ncbi:hypothetical protein L3X38_011148 [Prunus dulcis]|uniref:Uncharacterized protein n=1 Tax=Prunus dulcis TaxID=3755 RepID=A0AAD4WJ47_PRUDU|nr:hypothetical protein L3X38_011148 [Prunus dulcis]